MRFFMGDVRLQVEFNPKDINTFASASLDRTVKVTNARDGHTHNKHA